VVACPNALSALRMGCGVAYRGHQSLSAAWCVSNCVDTHSSTPFFYTGVYPPWEIMYFSRMQTKIWTQTWGGGECEVESIWWWTIECRERGVFFLRVFSRGTRHCVRYCSFIQRLHWTGSKFAAIRVGDVRRMHLVSVNEWFEGNASDVTETPLYHR